MNDQIGARLREERKRLKLTQEGLAARLGCSVRTYINYESGERSPDADFLLKAHGVGVDIARVMGVAGSVVDIDSQLPETDVEQAIKAVREVEIERLAFLQPSPLWVAVQHTARFGASAVGGFRAQARSEVEAQLRQPAAAAKKSRRSTAKKKV